MIVNVYHVLMIVYDNMVHFAGFGVGALTHYRVQVAGRLDLQWWTLREAMQHL